MSLKEPKSNYKHYSRVRNFAEHRCYKVSHCYDEENLTFYCENGYPSILSKVDDACHGKFTFNRTYFFFEDEQDAFFAKLLFEGKKDR